MIKSEEVLSQIQYVKQPNRNYVSVFSFTSVNKPEDVYDVGRLIQVSTARSLGNSQELLLHPKGRAKIKWLDSNPVRFVKVEEIVDPVVKEDELDLEQQVLFKSIKKQIMEIAREMRDVSIAAMVEHMMRNDTVNGFMDFSLIFFEVIHKAVGQELTGYNHREVIQEMFAAVSITERMERLKKEFSKFSKRVEVVQKIKNTSHEEINESREREAPEKNKAEKIKIKSDNRAADIKRFRKSIEGKDLPPQALKKFDEEVKRYLGINPQHSESNIIRTYLDYLSSLPWGVTTEDRLDVEVAKKILEEGHYGMEDIKARILEFLAVGKLKGKVHGKILCFVGPPGVGKTSIGKSIAEYPHS